MVNKIDFNTMDMFHYSLDEKSLIEDYEKIFDTLDDEGKDKFNNLILSMYDSGFREASDEHDPDI